MKKTIIEYVEKSLSAILSTFTTLGMFLIGNLIVKAWLTRELSNTEMIVIALVSLILTYLLTNLMLDFKYMRLEMIGEEMAQEEKFKKEQEEIRKRFEEKVKEI